MLSFPLTCFSCWADPYCAATCHLLSIPGLRDFTQASEQGLGFRRAKTPPNTTKSHNPWSEIHGGHSHIQDTTVLPQCSEEMPTFLLMLTQQIATNTCYVHSLPYLTASFRVPPRSPPPAVIPWCDGRVLTCFQQKDYGKGAGMHVMRCL